MQLQIGANHMRATLKGLTFTSKLIDGRFPDYNRVIPATQSKRLKVQRASFRETLNRAAILSNEKYRGVRFGLGSGLMTITAHNPEQEEAQEEVVIDYNGENMEIGFNVNYISEAVGALDNDEIEFCLNDPKQQLFAACSGKFQASVCCHADAAVITVDREMPLVSLELHNIRVYERIQTRTKLAPEPNFRCERQRQDNAVRSDISAWYWTLVSEPYKPNN